MSWLDCQLPFSSLLVQQVESDGTNSLEWKSLATTERVLNLVQQSRLFYCDGDIVRPQNSGNFLMYVFYMLRNSTLFDGNAADYDSA